MADRWETEKICVQLKGFDYRHINNQPSFPSNFTLKWSNSHTHNANVLIMYSQPDNSMTTHTLKLHQPQNNRSIFRRGLRKYSLSCSLIFRLSSFSLSLLVIKPLLCSYQQSSECGLFFSYV